MTAKLRSILILSCVIAFIGCGKKPAPPTEPPANVAPPSASVEKLLGDSAATPATPPSGAPNAVPEVQPDRPPSDAVNSTTSDDPIKVLNAAIDYYVLHENRPPKTVQELLEGGQLKVVPLAPPGMKYVIDRPTLKAKLVKQ